MPSDPQSQRRLALLAVLGLASAVLYWLLQQPVDLFRYYATPLLDLGKITEYRLESGVRFTLVILLLFGLYYLAFRQCRAAPAGGLVIVWTSALAFAAILAFAYPATAADVFDYILQARILAYHGANPFVSSPIFFSQDPFYPYIVWAELPTVYGPLWNFLAAGVVVAAGDNLLVNLLAFKGLAIAFYLADGMLIYLVLRRLRPEGAVQGLLLFAWNPLVLWETAANAHNDAAMMVFVLLGVLLMAQERPGWALPALALSALVKYAMALLLPLALLWAARSGDLRRYWRGLAVGVGLSLVLGAVLFWPFWVGWETLAAAARRSDFLTASPASLLSILYERLSGRPAEPTLIKAVAAGAFGLLYLWTVARCRPAVTGFVRGSFQVVFYYLLLAALWFQPWYLVWLVALGALLPDLDAIHVSVLFSLTAMLSYVVFIYIWVGFPERFDIPTVQALAVAVIFPLPVGYWLLARLWRPRHMQSAGPG